MSAATTRISAEERREAVILAATTEFGARGYAGTSTQAIAEKVGVSQPYLFQLFDTKKDIFIAAVQACFQRATSMFEAAARDARKETTEPMAILDAMGHEYLEMLRDRDMLKLQLQAYAACDDPDIQRVVRDEWTHLYETIANVSGADEAALHSWFAEGMLLNVAASIGDLDSAISLKLATHHSGEHAKR
jgi:AcrR family transcriptional regulator